MALRILVTSLVTGLVIGLVAASGGTAAAAEVALGPLQCGEDEREDADAPCLHEDAFQAGTVSTAMNLHTGGTAYGCNAEWATSLEFDLSWVPPAHRILQAVLVVRKTGYADDAQGFFYLGAFAYAAAGEEVAVPRADLTPETALGIVYPPAANVDLEFDVTSAVQEALAAERTRAGFLLAGIFSEAGYEDWITVGGITHPAPPRLVVEFEGPVAATPVTWSTVKALHR